MNDLADSMMTAVARTVIRRHLSDLIADGVGTEDQLAAAFLAWLQQNRSVSMEEAALRFRLEILTNFDFLAPMQPPQRPDIKTIGEAP